VSWGCSGGLAGTVSKLEGPDKPRRDRNGAWSTAVCRALVATGHRHRRFVKIAIMELGVHLPLMEFGNEALSLRRLRAVVDAARESGFVALAANDHFVFSTSGLTVPRRWLR